MVLQWVHNDVFSFFGFFYCCARRRHTVALPKVLIIYHTWIHHLHHFPLYLSVYNVLGSRGLNLDFPTVRTKHFSSLEGRWRSLSSDIAMIFCTGGRKHHCSLLCWVESALEVIEIWVAKPHPANQGNTMRFHVNVWVSPGNRLWDRFACRWFCAMCSWEQ
jgi:hypothetical protein